MQKNTRIGLVLDGGGGKGAYQIGVWQALRECGLDDQVTSLAGTSVGGLNAALFAQGDFEKAYEIWTKDISCISPTRIQDALDKLIDKYLDIEIIKQRKLDCFLATCCIGQTGEFCEKSPDDATVEKYVNNNMTYFNLRALKDADCKILFKSCTTHKAVMLATSAIPVLCHKVLINGNGYIDGGIPVIGKNTPVYPLSWPDSGCNTILVIHLSHDQRIDRKQYGDISLLEIIPSVDEKELTLLNGTLNFDPAHAKKLIDAGYKDSLPIFQEFLKHRSTADAEVEAEREYQRLQEQRSQMPYEIEQYEKLILRNDRKEI